MTVQQQAQYDDLRDALAKYQTLRLLYLQQREHRISQVQASSRDIEEVDAYILVILELQRDLAAEVDRTEGVA
jgi:ABC-type transporter lipoprotein component MlaA